MENNYIKEAKQYIEEHYKEPLLLDELTDKIGYSKSYFNHAFFEKTGQTLHNYIKERRLSQAAYLLRSTNLSLTEIAFESGYNSQQALTKAFKSQYGCAPGQYRKKVYEFIYCPARFVYATYLLYKNKRMTIA